MRQFRPSWHRHWRLVGVGLVLTGLTCIGLLRSGDSQQEEEEETVREGSVKYIFFTVGITKFYNSII